MTDMTFGRVAVSVADLVEPLSKFINFGRLIFPTMVGQVVKVDAGKSTLTVQFSKTLPPITLPSDKCGIPDRPHVGDCATIVINENGRDIAVDATVNSIEYNADLDEDLRFIINATRNDTFNDVTVNANKVLTVSTPDHLPMYTEGQYVVHNGSNGTVIGCRSGSATFVGPRDGQTRISYREISILPEAATALEAVFVKEEEAKPKDEVNIHPGDYVVYTYNKPRKTNADVPAGLCLGMVFKVLSRTSTDPVVLTCQRLGSETKSALSADVVRKLDYVP